MKTNKRKLGLKGFVGSTSPDTLPTPFLLQAECNQRNIFSLPGPFSGCKKCGPIKSRSFDDGHPYIPRAARYTLRGDCQSTKIQDAENKES